MTRGMRTSRQAGPGTMLCAFGVFVLFAGGMVLFMAFYERGIWNRLHEQGQKVAAVLSEKHVIEGGSRDSPREYNRLFFRPAPAVTGDALAVWARTSQEKNYPDSVALFDDWQDRIWQDVGDAEFGQIAIGDERFLWIDGKDAMLDRPEGLSMTPFFIGGAVLLLGGALLVFGVRKKLAVMRAGQQA